MLYEYKYEVLDMLTGVAQANATALLGWRLVSIFPHPTQTAVEQPLAIAVWERALP